MHFLVMVTGTLIEENDNEVFKLVNLTMNTYNAINLRFVEFLCEMLLCNLNMSVSQQVAGYHVFQICTMC